MSNERPPIWYSPQTRDWWLEPTAPMATLEWLRAHEDAIHVTNAYETLAPDFIATLQAKAGR